MAKSTMLYPGKIRIQPWHSEYEIHRINTMPAKEYIMDWFAKRIPSRKGGIPIIKATSVNDRTMILRSGTGSGKSTTLCSEFFIKFYEATKRNIAVTQPRILSAIQIPESIVKIYPELIMGENIGYQTGDFNYKPKKGIIFMTVGLLSQQLKVMSDEEFSQKYSIVIIDECHDRSLGMDLTLSLSKQFIRRNYKKLECPFFILTSATFNVEKYADYFGVDHKNIIEVFGLNYPIEEHYPPAPISDYIQAVTRKCIDIHTQNTSDYENNRFTDILVFVFGARPMRELKERLSKENVLLKDNNFVVIGLDSGTSKLGTADFQNIFRPLSSINVVLDDGRIVTPKRRIIVSTNVAETGVTIDTLKYLIDTGFENFVTFNPLYGSLAYLTKNITQASALQRKGRIGRRAPGVYYPMYTEETFNKLKVDRFPELISSDIGDTMLGLVVKTVYPEWDGVITTKMVISGSFDVHKIDMMDYPAIDSINYTLEKLFVLGLIDAACVPTAIGLSVVKISRIPLEISRMIMAGYQYDANILDLITIAAFMYTDKREYTDIKTKTPYSYESTFKKNNKELDYYNKFFIADDFIESVFIWQDFIEQIEVMKQKLSINHVRKWCKDHGLIYDGLLLITEIRDALIATLIQSIGLDPFYNGAGVRKNEYSLKKIFQTDIYTGIDEIRKLKRCIYEGFRLNMATWNDEKKMYILDGCHEKIKIKSDVIKPIPHHESIKQTQPKKIIVRDIGFRQNIFNKLYQCECDRVSVMDGYIEIDETFNVS